MCLSIPAEVLSTNSNMAIVQIGGLMIQASLDLVEDICVGDYVLIHTGFIIQKISTEEAEETKRLIREIENLNDVP
ncbi:MAG: HypC/HybG/HupF family hydrogenase formation chaperone [Porphyromonadaceae bacterium]|nr:MAG: HypC/HybG/HupF family hydrogenase formation chaperone [Porphyromonadaceae bacterium]